MKEHQDVCERGMLEKSAVTEHAQERQHPIRWGEMAVLDRARRHKELLLKEALYIQRIPAGDRLTCDSGLELQNCWTATLRRLEGAAGLK